MSGRAVRMFDFVISGWCFFFRWPVASARVFRPSGVFLGPCLQTAIFLLFSALGAGALSQAQEHWAPAFGFLGLSMLTGFFHEDGLADTADSLGVSKFDSSVSLEKIHSAFKDPRLGTFGVSALVMLWSFRVLAVSQSKMSICVWALVCLFSRTISLGLGLIFAGRSGLARSARSSHIMQSVEPRIAVLVLVISCVVGCALCVLFGDGDTLPSFGVGFQNLVAAAPRFGGCLVLATLLSTLVLSGLVRRTEALNGDLLGAAVCFAEVFLTACLLRFF